MYVLGILCIIVADSEEKEVEGSDVTNHVVWHTENAVPRAAHLLYCSISWLIRFLDILQSFSSLVVYTLTDESDC